MQAPLSLHVGNLDLERERALQLPVVQQNEWGEVEGGEPARGKKPRKRADSSAPDDRARATERTTRRTGRAAGKREASDEQRRPTRARNSTTSPVSTE